MWQSLHSVPSTTLEIGQQQSIGKETMLWYVEWKFKTLHSLLIVLLRCTMFVFCEHKDVNQKLTSCFRAFWRTGDTLEAPLSDHRIHMDLWWSQWGHLPSAEQANVFTSLWDYIELHWMSFYNSTTDKFIWKKKKI